MASIAASKLSPALSRFPRLLNYPVIQPRRIREARTGNNLPVEDVRLLQACLRHLYHDLGVCIFAGATMAHVDKIGDILKRVVEEGGIGKVYVGMKWSGSVVGRVGRMGEEDVYSTSEGHVGYLKPETQSRLATEQFHTLITNKIRQSDLSLKDVSLRQRKLHNPYRHKPNSVLNLTPSGPHPLPLETHSILIPHPTRGHILAHQLLFAVGTGSYIGASRIDYRLYHTSPDEFAIPTSDSGEEGELISKPLDAAKELPWSVKERDAKDRVVRVMEMVREEMLGPLWEIERETWAVSAKEHELSYDDEKGVSAR